MKSNESCLADVAPEHLEKMAAALKVLAHPCRLKMIDVLQHEREAPVHSMMAKLHLPQALVSQHLTQMRRAGLVKGVRKGKEVWYSISDSSVLTILDCMRRKAGH